MYKLIQIPFLNEALRGTISFIEFEKYVNFPIKRVYWLYNLSKLHDRGFHAHKQLRQILVVLQGSCKIILDNAITREEIYLNSPAIGLVINPMVWRELKECNNNSIIIVFASDIHDDNDYIRNYNDFLKYARSIP